MVIGITGNFGAGKTTVARMFRRWGAETLDADRIARQIIKPRTSAYRQILACFGNKILSGDNINRRRLAKIVFSDRKQLNRLNRITHPRILNIIKGRINKLSKNKILVIEAALLVESGLLPWVDRLVVVKARPECQMNRLKKNGRTVDEIKSRLNLQLLQDKKIGFADFVIDNSGSRRQTEKQAREIWNKIKTGGGDGKDRR